MPAVTLIFKKLQNTDSVFRIFMQFGVELPDYIKE
jgi:hypothetical protein